MQAYFIQKLFLGVSVQGQRIYKVYACNHLMPVTVKIKWFYMYCDNVIIILWQCNNFICMCVNYKTLWHCSIPFIDLTQNQLINILQPFI
jgi:hypothetical protein